MQFLTQSVTLSGLGTPTFDESVVALSEVYTVFSRQFPEGRMMPLQNTPSSFGLGSTFVLSNRYFTRRSEGPQMKSTPFPSTVDPRKILTRHLSSSLIHTEENDVQYFVRHSDMGKNYK